MNPFDSSVNFLNLPLEKRLMMSHMKHANSRYREVERGLSLEDQEKYRKTEREYEEDYLS